MEVLHLLLLPGPNPPPGPGIFYAMKHEGYMWEKYTPHTKFHIGWSDMRFSLCGEVRPQPSECYVRNKVYPGGSVMLDICCPLCVSIHNTLVIEERTP